MDDYLSRHRALRSAPGNKVRKSPSGSLQLVRRVWGGGGGCGRSLSSSYLRLTEFNAPIFWSDVSDLRYGPFEYSHGEGQLCWILLWLCGVSTCEVILEQRHVPFSWPGFRSAYCRLLSRANHEEGHPDMAVSPGTGNRAVSRGALVLAAPYSPPQCVR